MNEHTWQCPDFRKLTCRPTHNPLLGPCRQLGLRRRRPSRHEQAHGERESNHDLHALCLLMYVHALCLASHAPQLYFVRLPCLQLHGLKRASLQENPLATSTDRHQASYTRCDRRPASLHSRTKMNSDGMKMPDVIGACLASSSSHNSQQI